MQRDLMEIEVDSSEAGHFDPKNTNDLCHQIAMKTEGKSAAEIIALVKMLV